MKAWCLVAASALVLAACGADDHETDNGVAPDATAGPPDATSGVVWDAAALGSNARVAIEEGRLLLETDGPGPEYSALAVEVPFKLTTGLPAGDFEVRFQGVDITSASGRVGALIETGDGWASAQLVRDEDGWALIEVEVHGEPSGEAFGVTFDAPGPLEAELLLVRENGQVAVTAIVSGEEAPLSTILGDGPAMLSLYLEADDEVVIDTTTRAEIAGRELSGEMGSFDGDVIDAE